MTVHSHLSGLRNDDPDGGTMGKIVSAFSFHPATPDTGPRHDQVRELLRTTARDLAELIPNCPEATKAIGALQEAMHWANSAVAQYGVPTPRQRQEKS